MEDYYAILGLDSGASPESIKLAYRRLARECHPDRNINSPEAEKSLLSTHMAQLNVAYAALSDTARRREYDEKLRILGALNVNSVSNATQTGAKAATKPKTSRRVQPSHETDLTMVHEFSKQLASNLLTNRKGFSWKEIGLEGFDWGLECASWTSRYCVGARAFAVLDPAAAKKFANYSEVVVARRNRSVRKSYFLFLLPFRHLNQWESVSAEFNRLLSAENREATPNVRVGFVLFDAQRGRTLRIGSQLKEKHFEELLLCLAPELLVSR